MSGRSATAGIHGARDQRMTTSAKTVVPCRPLTAMTISRQPLWMMDVADVSDMPTKRASSLWAVLVKSGHHRQERAGDHRYLHTTEQEEDRGGRPSGAETHK